MPSLCITPMTTTHSGPLSYNNNNTVINHIIEQGEGLKGPRDQKHRGSLEQELLPLLTSDGKELVAAEQAQSPSGYYWTLAAMRSRMRMHQCRAWLAIAEEKQAM